MTRSRGINRPRKVWTADEDRLMRRAYPGTKTELIAERLGRQLQHVYARASRLGLAKSVVYLASPHACRLRRGDNVGAAFRYPKGHVPANKGLRRPGWAPGRMRETQFKKGQQPKTWVPIGTEVTDRDGYRKVKVSDNRKLESRFNWRYVHRLVWEKHRGKIPRGHMVTFRNGNKADCRLRNLKLISMADNARRNQMHARYPKHVTDLIHAKAALTRRINREEKTREKQVRGPTQPHLRAAREAQGRPEARGRDARAREIEGRRRARRKAHRPGQGRGRRASRAR